MDNKKAKILTIVVAIIAVIGLILFIRVVSSGDDSAALDGTVGGYVTFSKLLLIVAAAIAIILSILNLIKHPKALKKSLISIIALGVLLAIAYFAAPGEAVLNASGEVIKDGEAGAVSKWVSALIYFTGILGVVGLGFIVAGFAKSFVK